MVLPRAEFDLKPPREQTLPARSHAIPALFCNHLTGTPRGSRTILGSGAAMRPPNQLRSASVGQAPRHAPDPPVRPNPKRTRISEAEPTRGSACGPGGPPQCPVKSASFLPHGRCRTADSGRPSAPGLGSFRLAPGEESQHVSASRFRLLRTCYSALHEHY